MPDSAFLTISHHLFLSREERYAMREILTEVETVGICLPVWIRDGVAEEPAEEVFCRYYLRNYRNPGEGEVVVVPDGFVLGLGDTSLWRSLLDVKDGGCGSIYLSHRAGPVSHYISVRGIGALTRGSDGIC